MRRRNLTREAGYLLRGRIPAPSTIGPTVAQRLRLVAAICRVEEADPALCAGTDAARAAAIRLIWAEQVAKAQRLWLFGKPTATDLDVLERRVAELLGVPREELAIAIKDHRPATAA